MLQIGPNMKKIKAIKRNGDSFFITESQALNIETAKKMRDDSIKVSDVETGKLLYWGDPKEIKEFKEDYEEVKRQKMLEEERELNQYMATFNKNKKLKTEWSKSKMQEEGQKEKYQECLKHTRELLENAIKTEWVGDKTVKQIAICYWRRQNNCPRA